MKMPSYPSRVVSMQAGVSSSYHNQAPLEAALLSLAKAGMKGSPGSVRRVANQLIRKVPAGVTDAESFRAALHDALSSSGGVEVSFSADSLPMEAGGVGALVRIDEMPDGATLILPHEVQEELDEIVLERRLQGRLALRGLGPSRSVLFSGPPGVGKTLASNWVAEQTGLPLVSLDLAAVLSSYLGTSGRNIRAVLDFAKSNACVLLLECR